MLVVLAQAQPSNGDGCKRTLKLWIGDGEAHLGMCAFGRAVAAQQPVLTGPSCLEQL